MRKLVSILLLACMFIYVGGFHLVFALHQQQLKNEMRQYLQAHNDARFGCRFEFTVQDNAVTDEGFVWEEENQEFRYREALYDVVKIIKQGNKLLITALKDANESQLEQQLKQLNSQQHNTSAAPASVFKCFSFCYIASSPAYHFGADAEHHSFSIYHASASQNLPEIQTPPPRC